MLLLLLLLLPAREAKKSEDLPFTVTFDVDRLAAPGSSAGSFVIQVNPQWAPKGAARVKELIEEQFFDGCRFFRVIDKFMAQFGIHGDPEMSKTWRSRNIKDDKRVQEVGNTRGRISFAMAGPGTRTTQLFINFKDNKFLDNMGFTPVAEVISGMDVVDRIFKVGEGAPQGPGPAQGRIQSEGNKFLDRKFPKLTFIVSARISSPTDVPSGLVVNNAAVSKTTQVQCELSTGLIDIEVHSDWAPIGAERFLDLVRDKYFDGCALFRAVKGFLVQFGLSSDKKKREEWRKVQNIKDDPLRPDIPIKLGTMAFAGSGKNSRGTQVWIAFDGEHPGLGKQPWETPFAQIVGSTSLSAVKAINTEYGDRVNQGKIWSSGYSYLTEKFPNLDYIRSCKTLDAIAAPSVETQTPSSTTESGIVPVPESTSVADTLGDDAMQRTSSLHEGEQLRGRANDSPELQEGLGMSEYAMALLAAGALTVFACRCCRSGGLLSELSAGNVEKET